MVQSTFDPERPDAASAWITSDAAPPDDASGSGFRPPATRLASFAYAIGHDLAAPLRAVAVSVDLIGKRHASHFDETGQALLQHATTGARRMQQMIDGLAVVARIRQQHQAEPLVALDDLLIEAISAQAAEIDASGAQIESDPLPTVSGDRRQLADLLSELLANAIQFARPDVGPHVEIRTVSHQTHVVIVVRDNGVGVPAERVTHVFEPFQRLHERDAYPGLGLGLTRCREIAEAHRGFIYAYPNAEESGGLTVVLGLRIGDADTVTGAQDIALRQD